MIIVVKITFGPLYYVPEIQNNTQPAGPGLK